MPQSRNVRTNDISQHPEHTAERAGASHLNQSHERPEENGHSDEKHVPPPQQHEGIPHTAKPAEKK